MSSTTRIRSGNYSCQFWQEHANLIIEYKLKECKSHTTLYRVEEVIGKILNDVWEEIIIIGVLFETTMDVSLETPRFSLETPIFSLTLPDFHWRPPYFHRWPLDYIEDPHIFVGGPHNFVRDPQILVEDPLILIWDPWFS